MGGGGINKDQFEKTGEMLVKLILVCHTCHEMSNN